MWCNLHADANGFTLRRTADAPEIPAAMDGAFDHEYVPMFSLGSAVELELAMDAVADSDQLDHLARLWRLWEWKRRLEFMAECTAWLGAMITWTLHDPPPPGPLRPGSGSGPSPRPTSPPS